MLCRRCLTTCFITLKTVQQARPSTVNADVVKLGKQTGGWTVLSWFLGLGFLQGLRILPAAVALLEAQGGPKRAQAATGQDGDGVGEQVGLVHEVRRQQQRAARLGCRQDRPQRAARGRVHARGRLVCAIQEFKGWGCRSWKSVSPERGIPAALQ